MENFDSSRIKWQWKAFNDLTVDELSAVFQLRQKVFVVEQDCPYLDIDGYDSQAEHLLAWYAENGSEENGSDEKKMLIATLRFFPSYKAYENRCSLGRICTEQTVRRFGVGRELVKRGLLHIDEQFPEQETQIGAQEYLKNFYESFGFHQCSDTYDEDGIPHILMRRSAANS